ncbi:unnamed protein product, partial [Arabidopsis halleri]
HKILKCNKKTEHETPYTKLNTTKKGRKQNTHKVNTTIIHTTL